ncbi:SLAC1 anion channel family protein [Dyella telluris]|uniref:SLAC1 anion channel family protein n=1 Tax=Dyella telluris TaxID=2763498 RepID=A0A7G8Q3Z7_9GAMM|nr:SLAC1 anion channel family protein [Dyella telluris]QNK01505.1 SLAC1 anion channel family protein [Dyella telluris]
MNAMLQEEATLRRPLLDYLPVGLFGSVMGLIGLSVAWRLAARLYGMPAEVADVIGVCAMVVFAALALAYAWKCMTAWQAVKSEFQHPIAGSLFGAVWISLLLLPLVSVQFSPQLALGLWVIGACGMTLFAWLIVSRWMSERQQMAHATPAWIVPVVGLLDIPLAMPALGLNADTRLGVFAMAVGLFFAVPLFTLIFSRLLFQDPIPEGLRPSLMILVAPFSVGYSTYLTVTRSQDVFAEALYLISLFLLAVLIGQMRYLARCCPFRVSWWAVSFPLAASAICAIKFAGVNPSPFTHGVAIFLLAVASLSIVGLFVRTLKGLLSGELRTLSG